jgi:RsiW-degrading membrane proteinase PrsW (M82 family)
MNTQRKFITVLVIIFAVFSVFFFATKSLLTKWGIDNNILLIGNALLLVISLAAFTLQHKALKHSNPNVFIRSIIMGMMIKMFTSAIAVVIYFELSGNNFSGAAVFIFMFLYFIYMIAEVTAMMKLNKRTNA